MKMRKNFATIEIDAIKFDKKRRLLVCRMLRHICGLIHDSYFYATASCLSIFKWIFSLAGIPSPIMGICFYRSYENGRNLSVS